MSVTTRMISYSHDDVALEGYLASPTSRGEDLPVVLVAHAWAGRSEFENSVAERLAHWGYHGFALDLYGKGVLGNNKDENQTLMSPFMEDRTLLRDRLMRALEVARAETGAQKAAAIGFCFGGLCVLDMARAGADIAAAVSFHGLLGAPDHPMADRVSTSVLILHGWDDPMAPPADVNAAAQAFTNAGADWQLHAFGGTVHAFTNPEANDADFGTVYNERAARRAWEYCKSHLRETFGR